MGSEFSTSGHSVITVSDVYATDEPYEVFTIGICGVQLFICTTPNNKYFLKYGNLTINRSRYKYKTCYKFIPTIDKVCRQFLADFKTFMVESNC